MNKGIPKEDNAPEQHVHSLKKQKEDDGNVQIYQKDQKDQNLTEEN